MQRYQKNAQRGIPRSRVSEMDIIQSLSVHSELGKNRFNREETRNHARKTIFILKLLHRRFLTEETMHTLFPIIY